MTRTSTVEACFRERYPGLVQFLHGMLGDRPTAEDVAQEAFRRLVVRGPDQRPDADRWVFRVARRAALDVVKTDRRRREREAAWEAPDSDPVFPAEDVAHVRKLVADLPARAREVLLMQTLSRMSIREIAGIVGRSDGAVKQDLHRARLALRRAWIAREDNHA